MECTSYVLLSGPSLLDEIDHGVSLGHLIAQPILCQDNPGHQHHTVFILRPDQTALVDDSSAFRVLELWKEIISFGSAHNGRRLRQRSKKRTGLGSHPPQPQSAEKRLEPEENVKFYVRSSGIRGPSAHHILPFLCHIHSPWDPCSG